MPLWLQKSLKWCCLPPCGMKYVQAGNCAKNLIDIWKNPELMILLGPIGLSFHAAQNSRKMGIMRDNCPPAALNQAGLV